MRVRPARTLVGAGSVMVALISGLLHFYTGVRHPWLPAIGGFALTLSLACLAGPLTSWAGSGWDSILTGEQGKKLESYFGNTRDKPGPFLLGLAEATLFYVSIAAGAYEVVVGWLVFKTAAKWSAWQHIMRMPSEISGVDQVEYLGFRLGLSSRLSTRFLLGTLINVLAGAAGSAALRMVL